MGKEELLLVFPEDETGRTSGDEVEGHRGVGASGAFCFLLEGTFIDRSRIYHGKITTTDLSGIPHESHIAIILNIPEMSTQRGKQRGSN